MVQLMGSSHSHKVDHFTEEEYGPLSKRPRFDPFPHNQNNEFPSRPAQCNPLEEPSPLGLRLKKSPSLLDLIQMRLSKSCSASSSMATREFVYSENKKDMKSIANDKLKASNFPASLLKIGSWEYVSRYEGDLVAKCYFAKHKLVWEVLEGGLKSKIEIQWSDIMALKADCPNDAPGSLTIMLACQPVFFRETNPQPRKHTLWQSTSDFTDGQASINRQHYIQCPPGVLNKHYEKLIQCDMRLGILSQQPEKVTSSPFFELSAATKGSLSPAFEDATSTMSIEMPSPSSVMDTHGTEGNKILDECNSIVGNARGNLEVPGFRPSMSLNDFMNLFGECISEQMNSGSLPSDKASECRDMLENISQVLLSDNQLATGLDEKSLMKKVNSLCCILQDPIVGASSQQDEVNLYERVDHGKSVRFEVTNDEMTDERNFKDGEGSKKVSSIQRIDSLGDFLLHLPRIASLPKFLYGIAEDDDDDDDR